jgi:hypothetical protein
MKSLNKYLFICLLCFVYILSAQITSENEIIELSLTKIENANLYPNIKYILPNNNQLENNQLVQVVGGTLLDLSKMKEGLYTIKLSLGSSLQEFEVIVDTGSFLLWIPSEECKSCFSKNKFKTNSSQSLHKTQENMRLRYVSGSISGKVSHDKLKLGNLSIGKFKFLLSDNVEAPVRVDGIVGFSRLYDRYSDDFSLIDSLKASGIIKRRIFSQKIDDKDFSGSKLVIGNLPSEIVNDYQNFSRCQTIKSNSMVKSFWSCNLNKVLITENKIVNVLDLDQTSFNKNVIEITHEPVPAIFDTGSNVIIAPYQYYEILKDKLFKTSLENKECYNLKDVGGTMGFRCNNNVNFDTFPKLQFVFDNNNAYDLQTEDLFIRDAQEYMFRIIFSSVPGNGWLLGQPFLKQFFMVFDKDDDSVGFYHKEEGKIMTMKNAMISISETIDLDVYNSNNNNNSSIISTIIYYIIIYYAIGISILILIIIIWKIKSKWFARKNESESNKKKISLISSLNNHYTL